MNGQAYQPPRDVESVKAWLTELVSNIGMKIVTGPHAHYVEAEGNRGITAAVCIETSHIAFHVWDEEVPARVQHFQPTQYLKRARSTLTWSIITMSY
jgi:S-adenosylmethionine/arginine decarboxylase-like enzyme